MSDELQRVVVPVDEPTKGVAAGLWALRGQLLQALAVSADFADVLSAARQGAQSTFSVELPKDVMEAIARGEAFLKQAKDGGGLLPIVFSRDGKFLKQVQLQHAPFDGSHLALMRGQLQTHLMLAQLVALVEEVDRKVQRVLEHQDIRWRAAIRADVKTFAKLVDEPGADANHALSAIERSLATQLEIGADHLSLRLGDIDRATSTTHRLKSLLPTAAGTGPTLGALLDEVQTDLTHLAWGSNALAEIHWMQERPQSADRTLEDFRTKLGAVSTRVSASAYSLADFSPEREAFWDDGTTRQTLLELAAATPILRYEFTTEEVLCLK